jgi:hemolysin activation/secretion protein
VRLSLCISAACLSVLVLGGTPAHAQDSPEPAALERTIPQAIPESASAPTVRTPRVTRSAAPLRRAKRFTLGAVNIQGAKAFSREELSQYFEPILASQVDGARLAELAGRITQRYRQSGYFLSYASIPSQNVEAGVVSLAVTEGRVDRVTIDGAGTDRAAIEAMAAPLLRDAPLRSATLERVIGLIRDFPGLKVTDIALTRSDAEAGLYGLKIRVTRKPVRGFAYIDNRGTESIGRMRFYSSASFSSLAVGGDELRLDVFGMPGRGARYLYGQIVASTPLGRNGLRMTVAASRGNHAIRDDEPFDGDSTNVSAQLSYPLLRARALTLVGKASLNDWRSSADKQGVPKLRDRLRVARIGVEFSTERRTRLQGDLWVARGLGFAAMTSAGDPLASRPNASGRFTKVEFTLRVTQPLGRKVRLQGAVAGQYSSKPLLSVEEFALGGSRIGRAFDFNEVTGDHGIGGMIEVAYRLGDIKPGPQKLELFAYADGGATFRRLATPEFPDNQWLAGAGVGSRFSIGSLLVSGEVGVPIARSRAKRGVRAFFSLARAF